MERNLLIGIGVVVVIVLLLGVWVWDTYNGLIGGNENVNEKWANVETQYQRRFDLIPNLVSTVRGEANFEQSTLTRLTELRSQWQTASSPQERINTANEVESVLARLLVISENYPELRATQAFQDLMVQLEGTENRVAFARSEYNSAVRAFNVRVKSFPGSMIAGSLGFSERPFFQAAAGSENVPPVDFE